MNKRESVNGKQTVNAAGLFNASRKLYASARLELAARFSGVFHVRPRDRITAIASKMLAKRGDKTVPGAAARICAMRA